MAPTVADCDLILAAAGQAAGSFMVGHICRFDPRVALAKQAIDEGRIGQIVSMHARRNLSVKIGRMVLDSISALMGDGIHDGDLMLWFSRAKPVSVYAQEIHPGRNKYPDGGWAMARLDSGAIAVIESIWHLPESTPYQIDARMEVIGTEGRVVHQLRRGGAGDPRRRRATSCPTRCTGPTCSASGSASCVRNCATLPTAWPPAAGPERITPEESRAAVALLAAAVESAQTGQVVRF